MVVFEQLNLTNRHLACAKQGTLTARMKAVSLISVIKVPEFESAESFMENPVPCKCMKQQAQSSGHLSTLCQLLEESPSELECNICHHELNERAN